MPDYPLPAPKTWEELRAGAVGWLSRHWGPDWGTRRCPYCHNESWVLGDVLALQTAPRWPTQSQGVVNPVLQVVCTKCSHAVLINALSVFQPQHQEERQWPGEQRPTMY